jgi:hypothetical protein
MIGARTTVTLQCRKRIFTEAETKKIVISLKKSRFVLWLGGVERLYNAGIEKLG